MSLKIFNNISSLNAQRALESNRSQLGRSISRIASGVRITKSSDDAAGLAISESLTSDVRALKQGAKNLNDGRALINTAEGALNEQAGILIRLRELASQAATGTIGRTERETIQLEFDALREELDRIANTTEFNGQKLVDGSLAAGATQNIVIQLGVDSSAENRININQAVDLTEVTAESLGIDDESIVTQQDAFQALGALTDAIDALTAIRGRVGATQNRVERALNNLNVSVEGLTSALTNIKDADLAVELAELTKNQILVQAGSAMVSQSNLTPQAVLTLL